MHKHGRIVPPSTHPSRVPWWWRNYPEPERKGWTEVEYCRKFFALRQPDAIHQLEAFLKRASEKKQGKRGMARSLREELDRIGVPVSAVLFILAQTVWAKRIPSATIAIKETWKDLAKGMARTIRVLKRLHKIDLWVTQEELDQFKRREKILKEYAEGAVRIRRSATMAGVTTAAPRKGPPVHDEVMAALVQLDIVMIRYTGAGRPACIARIMKAADTGATTPRDVAKRLRRARKLLAMGPELIVRMMKAADRRDPNARAAANHARKLLAMRPAQIVRIMKAAGIPDPNLRVVADRLRQARKLLAGPRVIQATPARWQVAESQLEAYKWHVDQMKQCGILRPPRDRIPKPHLKPRVLKRGLCWTGFFANETWLGARVLERCVE